jgi:hypothetical protein
VKAVLRHKLSNAQEYDRVQRKKCNTKELKYLKVCTEYENHLSSKLKGLEEISNIKVEWKGIRRVMV